MQATEAMEKPMAARKKDLSSGELDALREIKNEAKVVKSLGAFWLPLFVALGIALGGGALGLLGWLGKRALIAEFDVAIKKAMQPITRDVGEIRKGQIEMGRKVDRMEVQQTYQAERIRDLVAPVERKIDRLEVRVEGIEKRMDRVEEKKR